MSGYLCNLFLENKYFVLNIGLFGFKKTHKLLLELYTIFITIFYLVGCLMEEFR